MLNKETCYKCLKSLGKPQKWGGRLYYRVNNFPCRQGFASDSRVPLQAPPNITGKDKIKLFRKVWKNFLKEQEDIPQNCPDAMVHMVHMEDDDETQIVNMFQPRVKLLFIQRYYNPRDGWKVFVDIDPAEEGRAGSKCKNTSPILRRAEMKADFEKVRKELKALKAHVGRHQKQWKNVWKRIFGKKLSMVTGNHDIVAVNLERKELVIVEVEGKSSAQPEQKLYRAIGKIVMALSECSLPGFKTGFVLAINGAKMKKHLVRASVLQHEGVAAVHIDCDQAKDEWLWGLRPFASPVLGPAPAPAHENFAQEMRQQQIQWRINQQHMSQEHGVFRGKPYPHLLPRRLWNQNLWSGIQETLPAYLEKNKVHAHTQVHNLCSSWVLCANLYFPFREAPEDRVLLATFLRQCVSPEITEVCGVELEYELDGNLHPSQLLGEIGGGRGQGQTSPDVAFLVKTVNGKAGLILTESKFTEHCFYQCSARTTIDSEERPANPDPARCMRIEGVIQDPDGQCHQCTWERRYWDHLRGVVNQQAMQNLCFCPAAKAGYQLFRQQALAEGIAAACKHDLVVSCVAYDLRNEPLVQCLTDTGVADFTKGWAPLFNGKAKFATFTHQQWVAWVREHDTAKRWCNWLKYMEDRYGF